MAHCKYSRTQGQHVDWVGCFSASVHARARDRAPSVCLFALSFCWRCVAVLIYYRLAKYCFELLKFPIDLFALMLSYVQYVCASGMPAYEQK